MASSLPWGHHRGAQVPFDYVSSASVGELGSFLDATSALAEGLPSGFLSFTRDVGGIALGSQCLQAGLTLHGPGREDKGSSPATTWCVRSIEVWWSLLEARVLFLSVASGASPYGVDTLVILFLSLIYFVRGLYSSSCIGSAMLGESLFDILPLVAFPVRRQAITLPDPRLGTSKQVSKSQSSFIKSLRIRCQHTCFINLVTHEHHLSNGHR